MTAPQDVILSEWFQRLQNICLQHILKQSAPFPSNPTACVWLVWTFIAALLNRNSYALISLICCLFSPPPLPTPPPKRILLYIKSWWVDKSWAPTLCIGPHTPWSQSSGTVPVGWVSWNTKSSSPVKRNKHLQSNIWSSSRPQASTISIKNPKSSNQHIIDSQRV